MPTDSPDDAWRFPACVSRVVDGDTYDVVCDLGFQTSRTVRVRLAGVDTAEIYGVPSGTAEHSQGIEHKQFVADWFADAAVGAPDPEWPLTVRTERSIGIYGRYTARVTRHSDGEHLADALRSEFDSVTSE